MPAFTSRLYDTERPGRASWPENLRDTVWAEARFPAMWDARLLYEESEGGTVRASVSP